MTDDTPIFIVEFTFKTGHQFVHPFASFSRTHGRYDFSTPPGHDVIRMDPDEIVFCRQVDQMSYKLFKTMDLKSTALWKPRQRK